MILVDTSIWIELLNGKGPRPGPDELLRFRTAGPILQEVLQGLRPGAATEAFRDSFLAVPRLCDPLTWDLFVHAADIYREGRRRGYAIRSSTDCVIAAIAIESQIPVWHRDRDFRAISRFTPLRVLEGSPPKLS